MDTVTWESSLRFSIKRPFRQSSTDPLGHRDFYNGSFHTLTKEFFHAENNLKLPKFVQKTLSLFTTSSLTKYLLLIHSKRRVKESDVWGFTSDIYSIVDKTFLWKEYPVYLMILQWIYAYQVTNLLQTLIKIYYENHYQKI